MLEQVEKKIEELKKIQAREYYKKKDADLDAWGLSSKKDGKKSVPIIVTNDEYEALIKASNGVGGTSRNKTARVLSLLAIVALIFGAIAGGVILAVCENMGFVYLSLAVVIAGMFAAVLKGVSEAISLLQQIIDARPIESPEISEEELDIEDAAADKKSPEQHVEQYQPQYAPRYPMPQEYAVPVQAVQPPIYQAQHQQAATVQPYSFASQVNVVPLNNEEMSAAYEAFQESSSEPQEF